MKVRTSIIAAALSILLAACGSGGGSDQVQPQDQVQEQPQSTAVAPTTLATAPSPVVNETPKVDPTVYHEGTDPMAPVYIAAGEIKEPSKKEDYTNENKHINMGLLLAINEYKMLGDILIQDLKETIKDQSFTKVMNRFIDECMIEDGEIVTADGTNKLSDGVKWKAGFMCKGKAYGYWALIKGTKGTEGNEEQCVMEGKCGYMFNWYEI